MNVLILTPDAVGSTLLQRMITIYMQFHKFDRPVINLHELTNGLASYHSPEFNREIVSKKTLKQWGYHQSLSDIAQILDSVDHYKTSRLAHYHIRQRGDTVEQQIPFYKYLNENFYIISCRRSNVFEHALSMTLNHVTKKLNVYNAHEKINTFYEIYQSGLNLDSNVFVNQLEAYKQYVAWSQQYFNISSYFNYEQDIPRIEQYILDLPIFINQPERITWDKNFGLSFNSWNKMHYAQSDLSGIPYNSMKSPKQLMLNNLTVVDDYKKHALQHWPAVDSMDDFENLPMEIKNQFTQQCLDREGIFSLLDPVRQQNLAHYKKGYQLAQTTINQMIDLGIIMNGPPIKKQTLAEKRKIIKNFDTLVGIYSDWAEKNSDLAGSLNSDCINQEIQKETAFWNGSIDTTVARPDLLPTQQ
jgi:hypothetical protein